MEIDNHHLASITGKRLQWMLRLIREQDAGG